MILHRRPSWKVLLLLLLLIVIAVAGLVAFQKARLETHRLGTANRLKHIEVAMACYRQKYRCYPPQYLTDRQGKPAHSWRVLLLEFVRIELYQRYRFDEPWNGPHNRLLATEMPEEYRSPFLDSRSTIAQYVGIAGKDTAWRGTTPLRREDVQRCPSNPLIWFVEAANSDINWMEPRDIPLEQALVGINAPGGRGIASNYSDGLPAQMKPFGQDWVPVGISSDAFRAMLTIGSGKGKEKQEQASPPAAGKVTPARQGGRFSP